MPRKQSYVNFILALSRMNGYVVSIPSKYAEDRASMENYCSIVMEEYCLENKLDFTKNNVWESFVSIPQSFLSKKKIRLSKIDTHLCLCPHENQWMDEPRNTKLLYKHGNDAVTRVIKGRLSPDDKTVILKACMDHCRFIPEKVRLPETETCELYVDFAVPTHQIPDVDLTTDELVSLFVGNQETDWQ
ncbi:MAG: hypothetical protein HDQ88_11855 [Clostridia bacterium]|nr:hypothetical protein [Clostridia bacterium]